MNKSHLKSYAPQARKDFIAALTARAALLGISATQVAPATVSGGVAIIDGVEWPAKVAAQRATLVQRIQRQGFAQTIEEVAYTWFNRLAALRYLELHDFLDHGYRVLSSRDAGLPELLRHASAVVLPGLNPDQVQAMQLAGNQDNALYKLLLVAQCNELSRTMPFLFERIDDDTELLLPDNLLHTDSIIAKLVAGVPEDDWQDIEVIGWLYQFYISEKKDQVIGKVVKSEDIPAATQLFTPNWIVQYLVQNSVGRLWLMANPGSSLAQEWPYYIQPAEQTPEVQAQLDALIQTRIAEDGDTLNPETITVLDPACGSGHILVVAYDVLKAIYLERGYRLRDIPRLILEKNLYGLDIDDRAAQMAGFALLMKARADDRRLLSDASQPPRLNIHSLQTSQGLDADTLCAALSPVPPVSPVSPVPPVGWVGPQGLTQQTQPIQQTLDAPGMDATGMDAPGMLGYAVTQPTGGGEGGLGATVAALIATFEHAKTLGSLIKISPQCAAQLPALREWLEPALHAADLYAQAAAKDLWPLLQQAQVLAMQLDAVVANPPYMGGKYLTPTLKTYLKSEYAGYEKDLFSAFMIRNLKFAKSTGQLGFMSPFVWMFISSYEELRSHFIDHTTLTSLVQLEYSGFDGATVPICTFTLAKQHVAQFVGSYVRLSDFKGADLQGPKTLEAIQNKNCGWFYTAKPDDFKKIPGSPVAYWVSDNFKNVFSSDVKLRGKGVNPATGLQTGSNSEFIRYWFEVSCSSMRAKWFPLNDGGDVRKWYGNLLSVINWQEDGKEIRANSSSVIRNSQYYFKQGGTWNRISSAFFSVRYLPSGFIFDQAGDSFFCENEKDLNRMIGFLNSCVGFSVAKILCPTLNTTAGNLEDFPYPKCEDEVACDKSVSELIEVAKDDWDSQEISMDFSKISMLENESESRSLQSSWNLWLKISKSRIHRVKFLEELNNRIFIRSYGLQDELSPEVPESQITLTRADREKDCQRLISYAIGCMMGRYSLDAPGLIYAHAGNIGFDPSRYPSFPADADGILPVTDEHWFADDAPARVREFLQAVWGPDTLAENLAWLAESLGPKASETPEETIRRYIASKFFKDHLQTYKKRPIYWLFSSGKQGAFQALVYLHRYHEGTLARMRAEYVIPLSAKMANRLEMLEQDANAASSTAARTKLRKQIEALRKKHTELLAYDETLRHYADMRITLDLDDGVKVNYGKFGDLLEGVKLVTGGSGDD